MRRNQAAVAATKYIATTVAMKYVHTRLRYTLPSESLREQSESEKYYKILNNRLSNGYDGLTEIEKYYKRKNEDQMRHDANINDLLDIIAFIIPIIMFVCFVYGVLTLIEYLFYKKK